MGESKIIKRLLIKATNSYDLSEAQVVPVNTGKPIEIESEIGVFSLIVNIKNFDGSVPHLPNSLYNLDSKEFLNGENIESSNRVDDSNPNVRLKVNFIPKYPIRGSDLLFGNDFDVPIHNYVPSTILSTGLKFFTWFISKTVKGEVYGNKPYLYGLALNSFTFASVGGTRPNNSTSVGLVAEGNDSGSDISKLPNFTENLNDNVDNILQIPNKSAERKKFFNSLSHCEDFVFNEGADYTLQFDTNFMKMADSKYAVSIPTFGSKTFDIDVSSYANDQLNNFNWVIKESGYEGVGFGKLGLIVNFALLDEPGH